VEANTLVFLTNGTIDISDNLWWDFKTNGVATTAWDSASVKANVFDPVSKSNEVVNPLLTGISRTNDPAFQLDPRPQAGSPALNSLRVPPNDGFYAAVAWKGAFKDVNWATDWTALGEYCYIATAGAGEQVFIITPPVTPTSPVLSAQLAGGTLEISFASQIGRTYQLQSTTNFLENPIIWAPEGSPMPGDGGPLTKTVPTDGSFKLFRVLCQ
jgi:hypothetical protein